MFDQYQWASSKVTSQGNTCHHYPKDEDDFKEKVVEWWLKSIKMGS